MSQTATQLAALQISPVPQLVPFAAFVQAVVLVPG
jgi:hypothetical protein